MEGLLSDRAQEHGLVLARRYWSELTDGCRSWWKRTTNKEYLESDLSRRWMRIGVWPLFWANELYADVMFGLGDGFLTQANLKYTIALDVVVLLLACVAALAPTRTLWPDALYSSTVMMYLACAVGLVPQSAEYLNLIILVNASSGLHPLGTWACAITGALAAVTVSPSNWFTIPVVIISASMCSRKDGKCALQFADLQRQQHAVTHLLEGAGDGSCVVCTDDGKIISSTEKLAESFGTQDLVGAKFTDFVSCSDEGRMEELYDKVAANQIPETTLVTCLTDVFEYEAKVIPYVSAEKSVSLCIQVQGERRFHDRARARARIVPRGEDVSDEGDEVSRMSAFSGAAGTATRRGAPAPSIVSLTYSQSSGAAPSSITEPARARTGPQSVCSAMPVSPPNPTMTFGKESPRSVSQSSRSAVPAAALMPVGPGSSSQGAAIDALDGALVPEFQVASAAVIYEGIIWLTKHWNISVPSCGVCCEFHACLRQISRAALELARMRPCDASWTRQPPWKCPFCSTHNHAGAARCYVCYLKRPGSSGEPESESAVLRPSCVKL